MELQAGIRAHETDRGSAGDRLPMPRDTVAVVTALPRLPLRGQRRLHTGFPFIPFGGRLQGTCNENAFKIHGSNESGQGGDTGKERGDFGERFDATPPWLSSRGPLLWQTRGRPLLSKETP